VPPLREFHSRSMGLNLMRQNLPPFLLGFLALSYQVILLREFNVHFYGNEITFGFILASWLLWGGLGSLLATHWKRWAPRFLALYIGLILVFPLSLAALRFSRWVTGALPGEITGMFPVLIFSLFFSFFTAFPLGALFVFNGLNCRGGILQVYLLESLGSAVGGLVVYFLLIPFISNWQASVLIGVTGALVVFSMVGRNRYLLILVLVLAFLAFFWWFDLPSQKMFWKPFRLIDSRDTPFGKIQVIQTGEQWSVYSNTLPVFSYPDRFSSEESVHFALLQKPDSETVLLIGGSAGSLEEILKYPLRALDYVELNPEIIRLSLRYFPQAAKDVYRDRRVRMHFMDGRAFLARTPLVYDAIILNLPDPSTALLNRFYTREFFRLAREKLNPGGVFSFRVSSAENYISPELRDYIASLYFTLKEVFPEVKIVPGSSNIFLASTSPLTLDPEVLARTAEKLVLRNAYVGPNAIFARLNPLRTDLLASKVKEGRKIINLDLAPISYFFNSVLWATQFQGTEAVLFSMLSKMPRFWLADFPLLLFGGVLFILGWKGRKTSFILLPLAVMGLTTITTEIVVLIAFQTFCGFLYSRASMLFAAFMIGLFAGALRGKRRSRKVYIQLLPLQGGFIILMGVMVVGLEVQPPGFFYYLYLFVLGFLGGDLFVVSNHLYLKDGKNLGLGYGIDLLGSFVGALLASSVLIPLFGLTRLATYLFLLNSFCFLFLFWGLRSREFG